MQYEAIACLQTKAENDVPSHRLAVTTETEVANMSDQ